jgi:DNA-binding transcriptional LysR family regulator
MNYDKVDLNLLKVFDAVMTELNVTRAAVRLRMTQPAVSNALNRLRRLFNDELFIKVPSGVTPTPRATSIWSGIKDAMNVIRLTLEPESFNPATAPVTFTLAMNDLITNLLLLRIINVLEKEAPNIDVRVVPTTNINAPMLLEQAEIDIAIGAFNKTTESRLRSQELLVSPLVCVMRHNHPLTNQELTFERYLEAKHLLVTLSGEPTGLIEPKLELLGLRRRVGVTVNQFMTAPLLLVNSDFIAILPLLVVRQSELKEQLYYCSLPSEIEIAPSILKMMWHERNHRHPAIEWLRSLIVNIITNTIF